MSGTTSNTNWKIKRVVDMLILVKGYYQGFKARYDSFTSIDSSLIFLIDQNIKMSVTFEVVIHFM